MCAEFLYSLDKPSIRQVSFVRLLQITTEKVEFYYDNALYCQINRIDMGFSLALTLVNIFMSYLDYKVLPDFKLKVNHFRYVDDWHTSL